ncbi:putative Chromodomain-helicase-DNA-binding protein [Cladorrhinum samala]|uniref:Chromodomain-helicase-DNA-binding protein n=1 Tax=Cladorrhinum samala TaxID=585594 RepID=A0AAV9HSY1_9PEZI|nr:putative Chromodomain-helicase-DNA-binding protein [Cladorrhinum samala]
MAGANGFLSSDDELAAEAVATEPLNYQFQSELSDSDAPDPIALDDIAPADHHAPPPPPPPRPQSKMPDAPMDISSDVEPPPIIMNAPTKPATTVPIQVVLSWIPPDQRAEYEHIEVGDYVPDDEDGKGMKRSYGDDDSWAEEDNPRKRKRGTKTYQHDDEESDEADVPRTRGAPPREITDYYGARGRHGTRASSNAVSSEGDHGQSTRRLRLRASARQTYDYGRDELQDSDDDMIGVVTSDIASRGRPRRGHRRLKAPVKSSFRDDSDIEFETRRRSSRSNKNRKKMKDTYVDDDDDDNFYYAEAKPAAPKVASVKEVFLPSNSPEFEDAHRHSCDSCGYEEDRNKGTLVPCQGCSNMYHKICLGNRSTRDQVVTKVTNDSFVMQCRFCVGVYKKRDARAPGHDLCQVCHSKNPSCAPFSERKTPKQEEKLRLENGGVDPVTPVDPKLINNAQNVLFRCAKCHRGWHYEHLPHPNKGKDPVLSDPTNLRKHRLQEYQIDWRCKECRENEDNKPDKLVAWRPVDRKRYRPEQTLFDFTEDELEYLVKWQNQSYNHCQWLPGPWVYGIVKHNMRSSFLKRTLGEGLENEPDSEIKSDSLLRWSEKDAIYSAWVTPDIILDVQYAPRTREAEQRYKASKRQDKFDDDMARIYHVVRILVKFEGLGYDDVVWDTPPDSGSPAWEAYHDAYREYLNGKHFKYEGPKVMRERVEAFRKLDFTTQIKLKGQPKGLQRGKLMEYQVDGVDWMLYNFRHDRSVILADEMGLGKTVQVVALLSSFIEDNPRIWPFLVVVPNATCANWRREIKKWAPDLRVVAYYGGRVSQTLAINYELFPNRCRDMKAHVVIMSYDSAKDSETKSRFSSVKWAGLIVDEAQALKNDENGLYKALHALNIPFKLLLTGTPLQNNKRELFNLLQFIDPEKRAEELDEKFANITSENLPELHEIIRPYFLRRTKAGVLHFLPPMAQIIVPVSMTVLQEKLCKSIMERNPQLIRSIFSTAKLKTNERGSLSNILMQLRKCLCHPFIYSQAIEDRTADAERTRRNLIEASSKLMLLEIMLPKLKERGHRVLIFSQFLDQLTVLEDFLTSLNLRHERLDGKQSSMEKQKKIDAFNAPDSDLFCMLLSTRAGGVGINLATADTVIILDPDWNPHQDIQALSRAHRIGQTKKVLCFQLMTVDSAEEKILQIGRKKLALDHLLIETMDNEDDAPNDVESVLKHGAAALFGEGKKKEAIKYDAAAVDKLLDRSVQEETKTNDDKSAESAFAMARVWANDEGALTEDVEESEKTMNLGVWDQILQEREEEARREAEKLAETLGRGGRRRGTANYKLEVDEAHGGPAADSDHGFDADFVGSDKSDRESSDEEPGTPGPVISQSSNSRNKQGKANIAQGIEGQASSHQGPGSGATRNPEVRQSGSVAIDNGKPQQRKYLEVSIPGGGTSSKAGQQNGTAARGPAQAHVRPQGQIQVHVQAGGQVQVQYRQQQQQQQQPNYGNGSVGGGGGRGYANGQPQPQLQHGQRINNGVASPRGDIGSVRPDLVSHQQQLIHGLNMMAVRPAEAAAAQHQSPVPLPAQGRELAEFCFCCRFSHPAFWECPEMGKVSNLRMAMDELRRSPDLTVEQKQVLWPRYAAKLRELTSRGPQGGVAVSEKEGKR